MKFFFRTQKWNRQKSLKDRKGKRGVARESRNSTKLRRNRSRKQIVRNKANGKIEIFIGIKRDNSTNPELITMGKEELPGNPEIVQN